jgi:excisionase family DNA binding protein
MSDILAYPIDEAAKAAGVTRERLYQAVRANELTARKAGRSTLVLRSDLETWLLSLPTRGKPLQPPVTTVTSAEPARGVKC